MLFSCVSGQQRIGKNKKCRQIASDFDCRADAAVRCRAQCRIAPAAAMVNGFVETTQHTNKTQLFLAATVHFDC